MENQILTPAAAVKFAGKDLIVKDDARERCVMITTTKDGRPIRTHLVGIGSYEKVSVDIRFIAKEALMDSALGVILLHTHPGSSCVPSQHDIKITQDVKRALSCLDIQFTDHIVVGVDGFYSFTDERITKNDNGTNI